MNKEIESTLKLIEAQIGLKLKLENDRAILKRRRGRKYFNVIMSTDLFSAEYARLESFAIRYGIISLEINGHNKVAIFINNNHE